MWRAEAVRRGICRWQCQQCGVALWEIAQERAEYTVKGVVSTMRNLCTSSSTADHWPVNSQTIFS